jgi:hypothetical protein
MQCEYCKKIFIDETRLNIHMGKSKKCITKQREFNKKLKRLCIHQRQLINRYTDIYTVILLRSLKTYKPKEK